jgi:Zn-dependent oligopeptidase
LGVLQAYQVGYTSPEANAGVVQRLLDTRQQIAELLDAPSYSHYQAGRDTLAEHPAAVTTFLQGERNFSYPQQPHAVDWNSI